MIFVVLQLAPHCGGLLQWPLSKTPLIEEGSECTHQRILILLTFGIIQSLLDEKVASVVHFVLVMVVPIPITIIGVAFGPTLVTACQTNAAFLRAGVVGH